MRGTKFLVVLLKIAYQPDAMLAPLFGVDVRQFAPTPTSEHRSLCDAGRLYRDVPPKDPNLLARCENAGPCPGQVYGVCQLTVTGISASMRFSFAFLGVSECNGDLTTTDE